MKKVFLSTSGTVVEIYVKIKNYMKKIYLKGLVIFQNIQFETIVPYLPCLRTLIKQVSGYKWPNIDFIISTCNDNPFRPTYSIQSHCFPDRSSKVRRLRHHMINTRQGRNFSNLKFRIIYRITGIEVPHSEAHNLHSNEIQNLLNRRSRTGSLNFVRVIKRDPIRGVSSASTIGVA